MSAPASSGAAHHAHAYGPALSELPSVASVPLSLSSFAPTTMSMMFVISIHFLPVNGDPHSTGASLLLSLSLSLSHAAHSPLSLFCCGVRRIGFALAARSCTAASDNNNSHDHSRCSETVYHTRSSAHVTVSTQSGTEYIY